MALVVKNPPANAGDIRDLGSIMSWEDPLEKEMAPTPVFLPGESHGQGSLVGYSPSGRNSQAVLVVKNLPTSSGDTGVEGSIPGSGRSPGGGTGNPLQYSCLENPHGQRSLAGYSP